VANTHILVENRLDGFHSKTTKTVETVTRFPRLRFALSTERVGVRPSILRFSIPILEASKV